MAKLTTIVAPSGAKFQVDEAHAARFQGLVNDLEATGYPIKGNQSGGYNYRTIDGTNKLSNHAHGAAIDVNWTENARGKPGSIPQDLALSLAQKHGLTWGGTWKNRDDMHFEVAGQPHNHDPQQPTQVAAAGAQPQVAPAPAAGSVGGLLSGLFGGGESAAPAAPVAQAESDAQRLQQQQKLAEAAMQQAAQPQPDMVPPPLRPVNYRSRWARGRAATGRA